MARYRCSFSASRIPRKWGSLPKQEIIVDCTPTIPLPECIAHQVLRAALPQIMSAIEASSCPRITVHLHSDDSAKWNIDGDQAHGVLYYNAQYRCTRDGIEEFDFFGSISHNDTIIELTVDLNPLEE